jgi:hypothetical protein
MPSFPTATASTVDPSSKRVSKERTPLSGK